MSEQSITQLDLACTPDYSKVEATLGEIINQHGTANMSLAALGHEKLVTALQEPAPEAVSAMRGLMTALEYDGVAVMHNSLIDRFDDEVAQLGSIAIASMFGRPTKTDQKNAQIAWPIRYDPDTTMVRTFSQSLGEAAYHTDTQYYQQPEQYFGLFCITADEPGKGTNHLIAGSKAMRAFRDTHGEAAVRVLEKPFPFRVPSVFTAGAADADVEITWAPIYASETGTIRYRKDTIERAIEAGVQLPLEQQEALVKFDDVLQSVEPVAYHLEPGDVILVNNHTMLHARTAFDNPQRFLYRVRMTNV